MTTIDPTGPVPPYKQIAAIIRARIESGEYAKGTRIPTESEMVETWEVARTTARRAIALLRDEGLVTTVPQRGRYVRAGRRAGTVTAQLGVSRSWAEVASVRLRGQAAGHGLAAPARGRLRGSGLVLWSEELATWRTRWQRVQRERAAPATAQPRPARPLPG